MFLQAKILSSLKLPQVGITSVPISDARWVAVSTKPTWQKIQTQDSREGYSWNLQKSIEE
jgi:hypothetical protein